MQIKKGLDISTTEFWYDVSTGGYLDPYDICKTTEDANKVYEATLVLMDFQKSCEEQIEGFIQ